MSKMKVATKGKGFGYRAILSTLIGESADSLIFFPIAFAGVIGMKELFILIVTQAALKTAYEIIILPVTYRVVNFVKRIDNTDTYDENISYKLFNFK